jgi:hypothetical protein
MANNAIVGAGAVLQLSISSVYTTITDITAIGGIQGTVGDIEVTNLLSPNVYKEYLPGWGEGGTVSIEANYAKTQFNIMYGVLRTPSAWKIIFSDGSNWVFNGYLNALATDNPEGDEPVASPFTIKITGKPVYSTS